VNEVLKKYPGIKVVGTIDDRGDPRAAYDAVSDLLVNKKEKIDGIICLEASGDREQPMFCTAWTLTQEDQNCCLR